MEKLQSISHRIRYWILTSTTRAGSGHPTSSLSAVELMTVLLFGGFFKFDVRHAERKNNDRLIFSKGHASPLFYALWAAAGAVSERELLKLRRFDSPLEGHPTMRFKYTEAATGSLGQGLSVGVGIALSAKFIERQLYRTYVLLGDSEMAEGAVWEAMQIAAHYKLDNLIGVLDVNRLGQRGATMLEGRVSDYEKSIASFGWKTIVVDGYSLKDISKAYREALLTKNKPTMIIAKTVKGKGVSFLEDKDGWHGKALDKAELKRALRELGDVDRHVRGFIVLPEKIGKQPGEQPSGRRGTKAIPQYKLGEQIATRRAYGAALAAAMARNARIIALDAEVSNSTYSDVARAAFPGRFFEMYIAEQNMVGAAVGLSRRGSKPFVSSFAAFLTRAHDQIRMAQYSGSNICFVGSHAGVSIGEDGPSQMGLEDIAMFRSILGSVVLYPCDAVSAAKLVSHAAANKGISYIRTTRSATPVLYKNTEAFPIGGSKILRKSESDAVTIVAAGITVHEALKAYEALRKKKINARVIDCYSIKPLDARTLRQAARETGRIITVEDHFAEGGLGEAVSKALSGTKSKVISLAVRKMPRSGTMQELLSFEGISNRAIVDVVTRIRK